MNLEFEFEALNRRAHLIETLRTRREDSTRINHRENATQWRELDSSLRGKCFCVHGSESFGIIKDGRSHYQLMDLNTLRSVQDLSALLFLTLRQQLYFLYNQQRRFLQNL
jgi:hypothetical protein